MRSVDIHQVLERRHERRDERLGARPRQAQHCQSNRTSQIEKVPRRTLGARTAASRLPKIRRLAAMISLASGGCSLFGSMNAWMGARMCDGLTGNPAMFRAAWTYQDSSPMLLPGTSPSR